MQKFHRKHEQLLQEAQSIRRLNDPDYDTLSKRAMKQSKSGAAAGYHEYVAVNDPRELEPDIKSKPLDLDAKLKVKEAQQK